MKISATKIYHFNLPFKNPLTFKNITLAKRQGLLLKLSNAEGENGYGEISPLPGFSKETLAEAQSQIINLCSKIDKQPLPTGLERTGKGFENWLAEYHLYPSVQCGFETAVFNLIANTKKMPLNKLLNQEPRSLITVNALLQGPIDAIIDQTVTLLNEGYRTFKLKITGKNIAADIEKVEVLKDILHNQGALRLDGNQSLDYEQAVIFGKKIGSTGIEYFEEPVNDPSKLEKFFKETKIPVAFDESFLGENKNRIKRTPGLAAVILKPTFLGSIEKTLKLMHSLKQHTIKPVISAAFESGVGIINLTHLASCLTEADIPAGLDTQRFLQSDLLVDSFLPENGKLQVRKQLCDDKEINFDLLTEVAL